MDSVVSGFNESVLSIRFMRTALSFVLSIRLCDLSLPVAGLITDELTGSEVGERIELLESLAQTELGCKIHAPFMHLSFLTLVTSPELKLTDKGLIDVRTHSIVDALQ